MCFNIILLEVREHKSADGIVWLQTKFQVNSTLRPQRRNLDLTKSYNVNQRKTRALSQNLTYFTPTAAFTQSSRAYYYVVCWYLGLNCLAHQFYTTYICRWHNCMFHFNCNRMWKRFTPQTCNIQTNQCSTNWWTLHRHSDSYILPLKLVRKGT